MAVGLFRPGRVVEAISETHQVDDYQEQNQRYRRRISGVLAKLEGNVTNITRNTVDDENGHAGKYAIVRIIPLP